jgi:ABC-type dipeptide/oligopeptide/nickel transport system permease subunit
MEIKEHVSWIAAMLATAVAFVTGRYRSRIDDSVRRVAVVLLAISFLLVALVSLLGVFANKVAPLQ